MKNLAAWVVVACCVLVAGWAESATRAETKAAGQMITLQNAAAQVEQALRPLVDELQAAANAHDTDRFMALYARRAELIAVFNGEEFHGWDDLHAQQLKWWKNGKSDAVYTERGSPEFTVLGPDTAVVTLLLDSTRTAADGSTVKNQFAISMVWKKFIQGGWKLVYSHESTVH
jgi:ketosteroid isomerase-like protein